MIRYFAHRPIFSITVFAIACFGSVWLFKKQRPHPPLAVTNPLPLPVSSKFTKIGKVPKGDGPRYELQFINKHEGWLAKRKHLWHTQDGGKTWELVHQLPHGSRQEFAQLQFINPKQGWATFLNYRELHKTEDGGRTWIRIRTPMDDVYGSLWTFHLEPTGQSGWIAGGTFQPIKLGDPCLNNARGSLPNSPYACLNGAVFRTNDGGVSWQQQKIPLGVGRFMSITVTGSDHVAVTGDAGLFQSDNGGHTWRRGEFRRECFDFYELEDMYPAETTFVNDQIGWLSFSSGLIANTRDGGKTWCDLFFPESLWTPEPGYVGPTPQFHSIHFRDAAYGFALGYDRLVYETIDGGAKWRWDGTAVSFETLVFFDNANGWAISLDQELYRVSLDGATPDLAAPREEPRPLNDFYLGEETLFYKGYVVKKLFETVHSRNKPDREVPYVAVLKNNRRLLRFDGFDFLGEDSGEFGWFNMLGQEAEQVIISQTVPRGGRHWVVGLAPDVRVLFDSADYGVGREEFSVIDIDKDGVYEISLPVTAFYSMQDKMSMAEIPLPEIIFKYDAKARRYLPANHRFTDYALHGIERAEKDLRHDDSNYLSRRLEILLRYIYAKEAAEGWNFWAYTYQHPDRKEITARIKAVLKNDPVYNYLY